MHLLEAVMVPLIQSWSAIAHDFRLNWYVYLSMPVVAALVGYLTKLLALEMMYKPMDFVGVGPVGWQGIIPRRAGKMASITINLLTAKLLDPHEILDRFEAQEAVEELREPLVETVDRVATVLFNQLWPGAWAALPTAARNAASSQVHKAAPGVVDSLLRDVKNDLPAYVDVNHLAVSILVRNRGALVDLMRSVGAGPMTFVRRSGVVFGFAIGLVQLVAWGVFHESWVMPVFGFITGFFSDWLALNLLFRPVYSRGIGPFRFQGVLHARREQITADYARILAQDIFTPAVLMEALLTGPSADRLLHSVEVEASRALSQHTRLVEPVLRLAAGTNRYNAAQTAALETVRESVPQLVEHAHEYAGRTLDIENTIVDKMTQLSNEDFELVMRPIFKDDEKTMIIVGGVLGFLVGELQVLLVERISR